jgi:chromosome segregation ATPase
LLREPNSHKQTQLDQLQTLLNNAITFQNKTTTSLSEAKSSLEETISIVQTISTERDDATTLAQHAQNELTNLRTYFDAVVSEMNALNTNQTSLNQPITALQTPEQFYFPSRTNCRFIGKMQIITGNSYVGS